jgi:tRNA1Val (adenine37-N6)-methyltransferase
MNNGNNIDHWKKLGKASSTFYFKQFKVEDGRSTMKVGTDAVLLGAVAIVEKAANILEIGTGCGVIALMLAQRSQALIDAIEIDKESAGEAAQNVNNCPWKDRIAIIHSSLQEFVKLQGKKYDLVISNPPFFSRSLKSSEKKRNISRHNDLLSFGELISSSSVVMSDAGSLWVILPSNESKDFTEKAGKSGFFVHFKLEIIPKAGKECNRYILQLKKTPVGKIVEKSLTIKHQDNTFTKEYTGLTNEFYIDF